MNLKQQFIKRLNLSNALWPFLPNGLYCFNLHRIGRWQETLFDPCVFSCDAENFEKYLFFLKENFRIITLDELVSIIETNLIIKEKLALITFDDGYGDNYELAFPVLKSLNVPATFFITTNLINMNIIPWWDEIAWHVKQFKGKEIQLHGWTKSIVLDPHNHKQNIRNILQKIKTNTTNIEGQLQELRSLSNTPIPDDICQDIFMTWQQVKEMSDNNMSIGAHSHTHQVLSSLSVEELNFELTESKRLIELNLDKNILSLSYPIGNLTSYRDNMFDTILAKGYKLAFTFRTMINKNPGKNRFDLGRFSIDQPFNERVFKEMILSAKSI